MEFDKFGIDKFGIDKFEFDKIGLHDRNLMNYLKYLGHKLLQVLPLQYEMIVKFHSKL